MGGQVLGGGVIIAVAVLLWIVYLLPTWQSRMRYDAAERNAVRLNQALRVLAETSETPQEIRVELSAREARAQHRLVRQLRAEDDRLRAEQDRLEVERKRLEVQAEVERTREEATIEIERRRRELVLESERRRREIQAARLDPEALRVRQARSRRAVRLVATSLLVAGLALGGIGGWIAATGGTGWWLAGAAAVTFVGVQTLRRMADVQRRSRRRPSVQETAPVAETVPVRRAEPVLMNPEDRGWTPRSLPAPLTSVSGSRAAVVRAGLDAREALRAAAREEALRDQAERMAPEPVPISTARPAAPAGESAFARMGYVDDAEIEQHVRQLLARRATG
ncbi:large exoprotein [Microbacterium betulae]|uniref:Large exoprotein n=1 Tax=Microbacterium betulae TaxID=2981139 RepID=A0AA97FJI7_9MICO|nr:large exoprotein [Microbacterium sp. AB]WOF23913.1 large exoprotein [Microbacterium sp. AB]